MPERAAALAHLARWGCEPEGAPLATASSLLWPCRRAGAALMLKLPDPRGDEAASGGLLRAWGGEGAVRLVEEAPGALLLERAEGPDLAGLAAADDDGAAAILGGVAARLRAALRGRHVPGLTPLRERARELRQAQAAGRVPAPLDAMARAALYRIDHAGEGEPLHGDLHHLNVLRSARGWLAIDPKGVAGPPAYELACALCNPFPDTARVADPARLARQARILAGATGLPARDLLGWAMVHGLLVASWEGWGAGARHWTAAAVAALLAGRAQGSLRDGA